MSAEAVGAFVMDELKVLDKVAYVRFASVYRDFRDLGEFMEVLKGLLDGQEEKDGGARAAPRSSGPGE